MILGIDPGERRVGVAAADPETRMARPVEVIDRSVTDAYARIAELIAELDIDLVVVGRPTSLSGEAGRAVAAQQAFLEVLRRRTAVEITEWDERLTTVVAEQGLRAAGVPSRMRKQRRDAVAAQIMLQGYLDARWR